MHIAIGENMFKEHASNSFNLLNADFFLIYFYKQHPSWQDQSLNMDR